MDLFLGWAIHYPVRYELYQEAQRQRPSLQGHRELPPKNWTGGKVRKAQRDKHPFIIVEEESPTIPRRGWAEMIRKVYEVNPLTCPQVPGTDADYCLPHRLCRGGQDH
jgi:hypothetical protein